MEGVSLRYHSLHGYGHHKLQNIFSGITQYREEGGVQVEGVRVGCPIFNFMLQILNLQG